MSKLQEFFKKLGFPEILTKLESEDEEIKVDDLVSSFQSEQEEIYTSKLSDKFKKGMSKEEEQKIYTKIKNSLFQKVKSNLKLTEIGNVKDYEDEAEFLAKVKEEVESRSKEGDDEIKTKYEDIVSKYNEVLSTNEELEDKLKAKDSEFETYKTDLEHKLEVKSRYNQDFEALEFGVSKSVAQDYKKWWGDEILNTLKVDSKSGKITKKDGTAVLDPETNRKVDTLNDWLQIQVENRGIGKKSNGTPEGGEGFEPGGTDADRAKKRELLQKAKENGVEVGKNSALATYLQNKKAKQPAQE